MDEKIPGITQRLPTPAEREKLAELLPAYRAALVPATAEQIDEEIGLLATAYPSAKISDAEAEARLELYGRDLGDIPADILRAACSKARRECRFFPSINEILERVDGLAQRRFRAWRVEHLIAKHDAEWREPEAEKPLTPAEEAEMVRLRAKFGLGGVEIEAPAEKAA